MPFINPGNSITQRVIFNSGVIDFGTNRLVEVDSAALNVEWSTAPLLVLNSIKPQDLVRHSQKVTLSGKVKSFAAEMNTLALGSSVVGTPVELDALDGQPTFTNPVFTVFDRNNKQIQYQFINALFKSTKASFKAEDYGEFDFELEAMDIKLLYTA